MPALKSIRAAISRVPSSVWVPLLLLLFVIASGLFTGVIPSHGQICNEDQAHKEHCERYNIAVYALVEVLAVIEHHDGLIATLATIAIAWFTWTLQVATDRQADLTRRAIELAQSEFNATHRPEIQMLGLYMKLAPENEDGLIDTATDKFEVFARYVNSGTAPAFVHKMGWALTIDPASEQTFKTLDTKNVELASGEEKTSQITRGFMKFQSEFGKPTHCIGHIVYADSAGRMRKTGFSYELNTDRAAWVREKDSHHEYKY